MNVVALALVAVFLNGSLGEWGGDNIQFLLLARALATGQGYVDLHVAGMPPHVHYPPLFPVLLVPLVAAGAPLVALKGWAAVLSVAGLNAAYFLLAATRGRTVALLSVLCTLCGGAFLDPALSVMSDGPYGLFSVLALFVVHRWRRDGEAKALGGAVAGLLIGAAILTRTVGLVLLPALVAHAALDRRPGVPTRRRIAGALLVATIAGTVATPWFVWGALQEDAVRRTYLGEFLSEAGAATSRSAERSDLRGLFGRVGDRPVQNLVDIGDRLERSARASVAGVLHERPATWFSRTFVVLCGFLVASTAAGLVRALIVRGEAFDWYVAGYLALLAVWVGGGLRLAMPVLVFLFAYCHDGIVWIGGLAGRHAPRRNPGRHRTAARRAGTVTLALLLVANVVVTATFPIVRDRLHGRYAPWWHEYLAAVRSVESITRPDDLVLSAPDSVPYFLAGLQAPRIRVIEDHHRAELEAVRASGATIVISTPFLRTYAANVARCIRDFPEEFETIDDEGEVHVYRLLRETEPDASDRPAGPATDRGDRPGYRRGHAPDASTSER